jgi:hypothetical protein
LLIKNNGVVLRGIILPTGNIIPLSKKIIAPSTHGRGWGEPLNVINNGTKKYFEYSS